MRFHKTALYRYSPFIVLMQYTFDGEGKVKVSLGRHKAREGRSPSAATAAHARGREEEDAISRLLGRPLAAPSTVAAKYSKGGWGKGILEREETFSQPPGKRAAEADKKFSRRVARGAGHARIVQREEEEKQDDFVFLATPSLFFNVKVVLCVWCVVVEAGSGGPSPELQLHSSLSRRNASHSMQVCLGRPTVKCSS